MKAANALLALAELSASQWGMFTTAQAVAHGVSRLAVARLADAGQLDRLAHGVYRDAGSPGDEFEDLRAAWLSIDPSRLAEERINDDDHPIVVSGTTAAWLHSAGDLRPEPFEFTTTRRRQTQRRELRYRVRKLDSSRITIRHGLPVTDLEQTIADLVEARTDLSLVAGVMTAAADKRSLDQHLLARLLTPLAARNGFAAEDGEALLAHLEKLAGIDIDSLATRFASTPAGRLATAKMLGYIPMIQQMIDIVGPRESLALSLIEPLRKMGIPANLQLVEAVKAFNEHYPTQLSSVLPTLDALSESLAQSAATASEHESQDEATTDRSTDHESDRE